MLEALVALGLAANVIQLVEFSSSLVKQSIEIRKDGSPAPLLEIKHLATQSLNQAEAIRNQLLGGRTPSHLSNEDQGLLNLVNDCTQVGSDLLLHIDTLLQGPQHPSRLQSLRQSVKIKFNQNKLDTFNQRLETLRSALSFDVVLSLIKVIGRQHAEIVPKIDSIGTDVTTIISKIEGKNGIAGLVPGVVNGTARQTSEDISKTIERCMEECWKRNFITSQNGSIIYSGPTGLRLPVNSKELPYRDLHGNLSPLSTKEKGILNMLKFRQMTDRFEEISPACRRTFEWIFHPPSSTRVWDDFSSFLRNDNQTKPYWVNGKAASGKSTLLKFILEHQKARNELLKWAGKDELIMVPFFFWNLGTTFQKSQIGLMRSLLYTVFERHPDHIRKAFPSLWEDWKASDEKYEPSYNELRKGFAHLITQTDTTFKMCMIIDGVDELEGDHEELAIFLKNMVSPRIKAIISSRPIPDCVAVFGDCPSLRLQDLTKGDIKIFTEQNLYENQYMKTLEREEPEGARKLVEDIQYRADGVFLWVKLVVKLLIQGMRNGDHISDLQRRLNMLPRDLEDLYDRMFSKMEDIYQVQAAETFQIIRTWERECPKHTYRPLAFILPQREECFH